MSYNRRKFIRDSTLLTGAIGFHMTAYANDDNKQAPAGNRLVLLGTQGGPFIRSYKQTPSANLIVYNEVPIIIDTGYGVSFKLLEAGIPLSKIKYIFITHHHSDHNLELGPLLYNAWIGGLKDPVHVYAPSGLIAMLSSYWESMRIDIEMRIKDEFRPDIRTLVIAHEYIEGTILSDNGIEVMALKNIHPPVKDSYALKFKLDNKTVVFSGDTAYCPALISFAKEADYLVHEVMHAASVEEMVKLRPNAPRLKESILSHHTRTEEVGKIATAAQVKTLVLTHFVPPDEKFLTEQQWIEAVRPGFNGTIVVGKDLLSLPL